MVKEPHSALSTNESKAIDSVSYKRSILPIVLCVFVVSYLFFQEIDLKTLEEIQWTSYMFTLIGVSILFYILRHLLYSYRLRVITDNYFSWKKAIELIFIWEFCSAVTPTSLGGSAVAILLIKKEGFGTSNTTAVILYTVVLDTFFFLLTIPILYFLYVNTLFPEDSINIERLFYFAYVLMLFYGSLIFYGLFINPKSLNIFLIKVSNLPFFRKYKSRIYKFGSELELSSLALKNKDIYYYLKSSISTFLVWILRFFIVIAIILAFSPTDIYSSIGLIYARINAMFLSLFISPTPGGVGFIEYFFKDFISEFTVNDTVSAVIAIIWRTLTYYLLLLIGAVIVPRWLANKFTKN